MQMQNVPKEIWVPPINNERPEKGEFYQLYPNLRHFPMRFFCMYRMNIEKFDELLRKLEPYLKKKYSNFQSSISWTPVSFDNDVSTLLLVPIYYKEILWNDETYLF